MRIKEEFNRSGDFWLPSSPENKIPGTLSISDGGDAKLELSKPLDSSIQAQVGYTNPDSLKRILGHVEKDGPVMIDRCYRTKTGPHFLRGRMRTTLVIWTNRVFMGIPYEGDASPRFYTCSFSVEGIDEWVDITGIEVDPQFENSTLTISYNRPEDITFSLENGMQLQITFAWTPPGMPATKRAEVTQKVYFTLVSKKPLELDKFISVAEKITAFLCFVWNEIVCLDSISATSDNQRQENGGSHTEEVNIYCSSWPYAKDEPVLNTLDVLFKYKDIQSCAESIIGKWLQNYKHIAPAYDLYFLTKAKTLPTLTTCANCFCMLLDEKTH